MGEAPARKLAVILHADVVGSTALVQTNETLAHQRIRETFKRFSETISAQGGAAREVRGDALVAEFSSVSNAVEAALSFQADNAIRLEDLPDDVRPVVRVGIAMGEVVVADETVTGEAVVLAQRLEQQASPGGICIQGTARDTIPKRLPYTYEKLHELALKGFSEPVRAYAVHPRASDSTRPTTTPNNSDLGNRPSVAVLPFTNMSGDPDQEYFSDGITEDLTTELSRFRELTVIARHSAFTYKGKVAMVRDIGESLRVGYVVEGSIRKSGDRVRITVQLIDASSEAHIWAERYDRQVEDVFKVQDEVTRAIVGILAGQVQQSSQTQATRRNTNANAYDYVLRAQAIISESKEANRQARELYEQAISFDTSCARAHAGIAGALLIDWMSGWGEPLTDTLEQAFSKAKEALALDKSDLKTRWELGKIHMYRQEFDQAEIHLKQALSLNPNDSDVMAVLAMLYTYKGEPQRAIDLLSDARVLNPFHPAWHLWFLGFAQFTAGEYEQAVETLLQTLESGPHFVTPHRHLAACYAQLNELSLAQREVEQILNLDPDFRVGNLASRVPFQREGDRQRYLNALVKAGLPH